MAEQISPRASALFSKLFLAVVFAIMLGYLSYAAYFYINRFGELEGEIVFDMEQNPASVNLDSMQVFLINAKIEPVLDSLNADYEQNLKPLESLVNKLKEESEAADNSALEQEMLFDLTYSRMVKTSREYIQAKGNVDQAIQDKSAAKQRFLDARERLLAKQTSYNNIIATQIDNSVVLKAPVDAEGRFKFEKVENGDYYVYALRMIIGGEDITRVPADMYYIFALTGEPLVRYAWMEKITVDEKTYIRLDKSNMKNVFK